MSQNDALTLYGYGVVASMTFGITLMAIGLLDPHLSKERATRLHRWGRVGAWLSPLWPITLLVGIVRLLTLLQDDDEVGDSSDQDNNVR